MSEERFINLVVIVNGNMLHTVKRDRERGVERERERERGIV